MKKVFTTGQVAKICKVAPRTVSKWFDSGRLRGYRIPGSQDRRIPREHLLRFLKEHGMPLGDLEAEVYHKILVVGADAPPNLEPIWRVLLKNEFHDILPGSSIREVYEDAEAELAGVIEGGTWEQTAALQRLVARLPVGEIEDALVIVNPSLDARPITLTRKDGEEVASDETIPPLAIRVLAAGGLKSAEGLSGDARRGVCNAASRPPM